MDIQPIEILKWIGIALAAGFVGYFGRCVAVLILGRIRKRKIQQTTNTGPVREISYTQNASLEKSRIKLEKKRVKQEAKKAKKAQTR